MKYYNYNHFVITITLTDERNGDVSEEDCNKLVAAQTGTVDVIIVKQDSTRVICTVANFGRSSVGYDSGAPSSFRIFGVNSLGTFYININMRTKKAHLSWAP